MNPGSRSSLECGFRRNKQQRTRETESALPFIKVASRMSRTPDAKQVLAFFNKVGIRKLLDEAVLAAALDYDHLRTHESLLHSLQEVWNVIKRSADDGLAQRRAAKGLEEGGAGGGESDSAMEELQALREQIIEEKRLRHEVEEQLEAQAKEKVANQVQITSQQEVIQYEKAI